MSFDVAKYTDKYFSRTKQILEAKDMNPWVRAQIFIRKGPGRVLGIEAAIAMIEAYTDLNEVGGEIHAMADGETYSPGDVVMVIYAPIQTIVEWETIYLGIISYATSADRCSFTIPDILANTRKTFSRIRKLIGPDRELFYLGARHAVLEIDHHISQYALQGGADRTSTDAGDPKGGIGTIPHALENIYAAKHEAHNAVYESTAAFDEVIDKAVPRIALPDYANREVEDSLRCAKIGSLHGVRVDTCGENLMQLGNFSANVTHCSGDAAEIKFEHQDTYSSFLTGDQKDALVRNSRWINVKTDHLKYWSGNGVKIPGVVALRTLLPDHIKIYLTSGFGNPTKVAAFVEAEKQLEMKLFDGIGAGDVYGVDDYVCATMDITSVAFANANPILVSKVGRHTKDNAKLKRRF
jgi:nicotinate phosphoribosyltransferase